MPGEALLVEGDDHLGALDVRLLGWDQVSLIRIFPGKKEKLVVVGVIQVQGLLFFLGFFQFQSGV